MIIGSRCDSYSSKFLEGKIFSCVTLENYPSLDRDMICDCSRQTWKVRFDLEHSVIYLVGTAEYLTRKIFSEKLSDIILNYYISL